MPVEHIKSDIFGSTGASGYTSPNSASRNGRINRVAGTVACAADALTGSTYLLASVPSSAIMLPESAIMTTAWGFAQAVVGTLGVTDGLLDVTKATGGASGNNPITIFGAKWNVPVWQQFGLAADPGIPLDILAIAQADATGAGSIKFDLVFANHI